MSTFPSNISLDRVRECWAERLGVSIAALQNPGLTLIANENSYGITALKFLDSTVAICQPSLFSKLSLFSASDLLDMHFVLRALAAYKIHPIGIASISYADESSLKGNPHFIDTHPSNLQEAEAILAGCPESELEESGLAKMSFHFVATTEEGIAGAVAGFEVWNDKIAQMGVLTTVELRRKGLAASAAHAAAKFALQNNLIPQWRCQIGNTSSLQLSQKLGFHEVGVQLAIDVEPSLN